MLTGLFKQSPQVAQKELTQHITTLGVLIILGFCSTGLRALWSPHVEVRHITQVTLQHPHNTNYQQELFDTALVAVAKEKAPNAIEFGHCNDYPSLSNSLPRTFHKEDYRLDHGEGAAPIYIVVQVALRRDLRPGTYNKEIPNTTRIAAIQYSQEENADRVSSLCGNEADYLREEKEMGEQCHKELPNMTRPAVPIMQYASRHPLLRKYLVTEAGEMAASPRSGINKAN